MCVIASGGAGLAGKWLFFHAGGQAPPFDPSGGEGGGGNQVLKQIRQIPCGGRGGGRLQRCAFLRLRAYTRGPSAWISSSERPEARGLRRSGWKWLEVVRSGSEWLEVVLAR